MANPGERLAIPASRPDFDNFSPLDRYAWLLYNLRMDNSRLAGGLFFNQPKLRDHAKHCILWSIIRFHIWNSNSSRQLENRRERARLLRNPEADDEALEDRDPEGQAGEGGCRRTGCKC
jgi:hypothetical protein